jgi:hypothetical protein
VAFGFIHFNDTPLQVSITGSSGTFPSIIQSTPDRTYPSQFNITNPLPCDDYNLTFILRPGQSVHIDQFSSVPCPTSGDESQAASTSSSVETPTNPPIASTSRNSLSAGLIVGLVLSSLLLLLILCGIMLLFMRWRRRQQRSGSGSGTWSRLPGYRARQSPSAPVFLSVGSGGGIGEVPPKSRFGLYMFKFKPPASAAVTQELSPSLLATPTEPQAPPRPVSPEPQGWFDANRDKPPRYSRGDWAADPDLEMGGPVVRGYLPDSKEWIPPQGDEQGDHSSEWGTVPTNHAVESVVI